MKKILLASAVSVAALMASAPTFAQLSASATVTNNYLWRGLTQSMNEAAVQGGVEYGTSSGLYFGTWVSNVEYDPGDAYSYEHDMYFGFGGEAGSLSYDLGYLYYNYDENAGYDFGEVYGSISVGNFTLGGYFLTNAEPDEAPGEDFGAFKTYYLYGDYGIPLQNDLTLGLHLGYHKGDFAESFNGVTDDYFDYNISLSKGGFTAMISKTTLGTDDNGDGFEDYASEPPRDNDEIKFAISYTIDFEL